MTRKIILVVSVLILLFNAWLVFSVWQAPASLPAPVIQPAAPGSQQNTPNELSQAQSYALTR